MCDKEKTKIRVESGLAGVVWFAGWLFTIGYAKLIWWQMILGIVAWPYFLGAYLAAPAV